ncbi:rop guanine nucleotide exchange factor 1-like [Ipomoea triloba]|uniref:rop guanine nucleotide exchange factor 1-like n=1 Tax=Ipomoea triloba TaxID=35885 RepID=UPI00125E8E16|nr:rop guanine nucleotide exchange factor 1-like [Ipomoea triloba]
MASGFVSSEEDEFDAGSDGYSISADVSESESSTSSTTFSCGRLAPSSSLSTTPLAAFCSNSNSPPPAPTMFPAVVGGRHVFIPTMKPPKSKTDMSEVELMKSRFAKLLLGEDMSGGGKGVCTALAISNAITNLAASVFGELWKLEPLAPQKKSIWRREMEWLLSVSDSIVELVPSMQEFPNGGTFEVMVPQPRSDLYINLPALKKLDAILINILDGFHNSEFRYVDRGVVVADGEQIETCPRSLSSHRPSIRLEEKWWLPFPKVPSNGLSEESRNQLIQCRECTSQIFKAALAINTSVLFEMEVPKVYMESLPKSGKESLGETLYSDITTGQLSPECLLDYLDLSSEYTASEIANRIEAAMHIWRQKHRKKQLNPAKSGKASWGGTMKGLVGNKERNKMLSERAEAILRSMKLNLPGLRQTTLDMQKIQYNRDVGQSILESYSRVLESIAFNLMARIDDLFYIDDATRRRVAAESSMLNQRGCGACSLQRQVSSGSLSYQRKHSAPLPTDQAFRPSASLVDVSRRTHNMQARR